MNKRKKVDSKEIGLEIGLNIGKHVFHTEHLHYGYWTKGLDINLNNLPQAQENHSDYIISHIPKGSKTILDVGCGVGRIALKLINIGYNVDCVSPSSVFTEYTRNLLGDKSHIFECNYEELQTDNQYDVILFSESFQYVNLEKAVQKSVKYLNDGGYLLICDFFKINSKEKGVIGGGHKLVRFYDLISQAPLKPIKDIDITNQIAPNLDLVNKFLTNVGQPVWNLSFQFLNSNYPLLSKFIQWKYRKKIERINRKYFSGLRNAENFSRCKSYRLLLYKKVNN